MREYRIESYGGGLSLVIAVNMLEALQSWMRQFLGDEPKSIEATGRMS